MSNRIDKHTYYLNIAEQVAKRATCIRRNFGAVIVNNDEIISTGYTGSPRGRQNCMDMGKCTRTELNVPSGQRYEICRSVHAEQNAIISAARTEMMGSTLYLVGIEYETQKLIDECQPCSICKRMIINAGIENVIIKSFETGHKVIKVEEWITNDDSLEGNTDYLKK